MNNQKQNSEKKSFWDALLIILTENKNKNKQSSDRYIKYYTMELIIMELSGVHVTYIYMLACLVSRRHARSRRFRVTGCWL